MSETDSNDSQRSILRLNRKTVTILAALTAAAVLSAALVFQPPGFKERVLHLFGWYSKVEIAVKMEYGYFKQLVNWTCQLGERPPFSNPPERLHEFFAVDFPEKDHEFRGGYGFTFRYLSTGIDPWGTPFIYEVKQVGVRESGLTEYQITVRSVGSNLRDEQGAGDDLQRIVPVLFRH